MPMRSFKHGIIARVGAIDVALVAIEIGAVGIDWEWNLGCISTQERIFGVAEAPRAHTANKTADKIVFSSLFKVWF